jgi:hypothetical protein
LTFSSSEKSKVPVSSLIFDFLRVKQKESLNAFHPGSIRNMKKAIQPTIKKQQFSSDDVEAGTTKISHHFVSSKNEGGYSAKRSHYSERALSTVQARKGFSMIYLHFELAWQSVIDYVGQYDDYLWEVADHLIESHKVNNNENNQSGLGNSRRNQVMPSSENNEASRNKSPATPLKNNIADEKTENQSDDRFQTLSLGASSPTNDLAIENLSEHAKTKVSFSEDNARAEPKSNSFGSPSTVPTTGVRRHEGKAWPNVEHAEPKSFRSPNDKLAKGDKQHKTSRGLTGSVTAENGRTK